MDDEDRRAVFTELAAVVLEPVRRYLARRTDPATAQDVLSETLLVLWRRLDDVPGTPDDATAWTIGVARGQLANADRSVRRQGRLVARLISTGAPSEVVPDPATAVVGAAADSARAAAGLARLGAGDAEVLRLWAWEGLEPRAIARVLGISADAAAARLSRARRRLRAVLDDEGPAPRSAW